MDYSCTDEMHVRCSNNALCHLCDGVRLFKDPVAEKKEKFRQREENKQAKKQALLKTHQKEKKEGMGFEKDVAKQWNQRFGGTKKKAVAKPRISVDFDEPRETEDTQDNGYTKPSTLGTPSPPPRKKTPVPEAKRQVNSGAFWHSKGDIKLEHALMECKERGTVNARGEKQITIPKEWLDKQEKEAFQEQRDYWYIPFRYKGETDTFLIKPYDHEIEMIYEIRKLKEENDQLKEQLAKEKGSQQ